MVKNSFEKWMDEEMQQMPPPRVKEKVSRTVLLMDFIAQVVDLYLPRAMDTFVALSGAEEESEALPKEARNPHTDKNTPSL